MANPLNPDDWDGIVETERALKWAELQERLNNARDGPPTDPELGHILWEFLVEQRLRNVINDVQRIRVLKRAVRALLITNILSWILIYAGFADLKPSMAVRLGIVADLASELIMSEEEAIAAGIPGARSGTIQIPDDIPNPEFFGRIYPQGTAFVKTQGPHGADYGHAAIDYSAGNGTAILSPINGVVTAKYIDGYGNPTLKIENVNFAVTMLHMSKIHVEAGDRVEAGQHVADEGNLGYSLCSDGQKPNGRDCGYHIHIDVDHQVLGQLDAADYLDRYLGGQ